MIIKLLRLRHKLFFIVDFPSAESLYKYLHTSTHFYNEKALGIPHPANGNNGNVFIAATEMR